MRRGLQRATQGFGCEVLVESCGNDIRQVLKSLLALEGEAKVTPDGLCPYVWVEGLAITGEA